MEHESERSNYECECWQGLLQILVYLSSRGYHYHQVQQLPARKKDKWKKIDERLIEKFGAGLSKFQRARRKKDGMANFYYLRWQGLVVIIHTPGIIPVDLQREKFQEVKSNPIRVRLSENISMDVYYDEATKKFSARMSRDSYLGFKAVLENACKCGLSRTKEEFERTNGIPAWHGVVQQKKTLARHVLGEARRHNIEIRLADLRLNTKRTIYDVFAPQD